MAKKIGIKRENKDSFLTSLILIFSNRRYVYLSLLSSIIFWLVISIINQYSWLEFVLMSSWFDFHTKTSLLVSTLFENITNITTFSDVLYIVIAFLVGINISVVIFSIKKYAKIHKSVGLGTGALMLGIIGVGCVSCGSFLLASILGTTTILSIIYYLPLKGSEINLLVLVLLLLSIYLSVKQVKKYNTCTTKHNISKD